MEVALDQLGMRRRGRVEVAEDDALGREPWIEMGHHRVGVVLDLQPGAIADVTGGLEDLAGHAVEVLGAPPAV